jgi:hypothetical protein
MEAFPKHNSPTRLTRGIIFTPENAASAHRLMQLRNNGEGQSIEARLLELRMMSKGSQSKKGSTNKKGGKLHFGKLKFPKKQ